VAESRAGLLHLPLPGVVLAGERRRRPQGGARSRRYEFGKHGEAIREQLVVIKGASRVPTLNVNPEQILVLELNQPLEVEELSRAGLLVLDTPTEKRLVIYAHDPDLNELLTRLDRYVGGPPTKERVSAPYESLFDSIDSVRRFGPGDRITARLREAAASGPPGQILRLDVECWHPSPDLAGDWLRAVAGAVEAAGGRVADRYLNHSAGLALARAYLPADRVQELANIDSIARIDLLPNPRLSAAEIFDVAASDLPTLQGPPSSAPLVGLVDSGVLSGHPLLVGCLSEVTTLVDEFNNGEDEAGHGTAVASLLLYGPLEDVLEGRSTDSPYCRVISVKILDRRGQFPDETLYEHALEDAIRHCAARGAKIVNLSVGDRDTIYRGPRSTPVAALIDALARELQLVFVISAGNTHPSEYANRDLATSKDYPLLLAATSETAILDPAPAALALTVGGLCVWRVAGGVQAREAAGKIPLGDPGWPSPFTRHGPGIGGAVKPEVAAPGGSLAFDPDSGFVADNELGLVTASGRFPARLLEVNIGTSFAAPLAARGAAAILARYPAVGPNLVRALILQALADSRFVDAIEATPAKRMTLVRQLTGYGVLRLPESVASTDHRVVLVAEDSIPIDGTHIYPIPVPSSFFESGGSRWVTVALAYDPPTRARRLDYLASKMDFYLIRAMELDEIEKIFLTSSPDELELVEESESPSEDESHQVDLGDLPPSKLGRHLVHLHPAKTIRSRGTNQFGRARFATKFREDDSNVLYLVVKSTNQWADASGQQSYGLAVTLERDVDRTPLYAEIEARIGIEVELSA
jgi:subtilisin family serine protease